MGEKILIADDDPDIVRLIEVSLTLEGYDVITAHDGQQALDLATSDMPDLVLLDVMMPKMDGVEVCRRLREDPRGSSVAIIMLTAKSLSADKLSGLTAGADDYISKPFDPVEVMARIATTLRRSRAMRDASPLTSLPGNNSIVKELDRRIGDGKPFALLHADLDNFKAFNDHYGFVRGDEAIKLAARVIQEAAHHAGGDGAFVGHIGGDDFAVVCGAAAAENVAQEIISRLEAEVPRLYDDSDVEKGAISVIDRTHQVREFPLMTISIGIATNENRTISTHAEASSLAVEMKGVAKSQPGSTYAVDRRRGGEPDGR